MFYSDLNTVKGELKNLMVVICFDFIENDTKQIFLSEKKPTLEPFFASTASPLSSELQEIVKLPEPSMGVKEYFSFFHGLLLCLYECLEQRLH
jgi:hypothetical protein